MFRVVIKREDGSMTGYEVVRMLTIYTKSDAGKEPEIVLHTADHQQVNIPLSSFVTATITTR